MYADAYDMEVRFGEAELIEITDRSDSGQYDDEFVLSAIEDASAEIDSYVAVRYTLPLSDVPPLLRRLCCDIARFRLYDDSPTEEVRRRYDSALEQLQRVARGELLLAYEYGMVPMRAVIKSAPKRLAFGDRFDQAYDAATDD